MPSMAGLLRVSERDLNFDLASFNGLGKWYELKDSLINRG